MTINYKKNEVFTQYLFHIDTVYVKIYLQNWRYI